MKVEIIFTSDFADKKKGDKMICNGMLASQLINNDKVAIKSDEAKKKEAVSKVKKPANKK